MNTEQRRTSIRNYLDTPVSESLVRELIDYARQAPSGKNLQPWRFIAVRDTALKERLAEASHAQRWMLSAPIFLVCIADVSAWSPDPQFRASETSPEQELKESIRDAALAMAYLIQAAEQRGLGTCCVAWYEQQDIKPILNLPDDQFAVSIITLGWPAENPSLRPRKGLDEILSFR